MSDSTARRDLTTERIVATAGTIVRERGVEALTMRRLATECRVTPMALYHHVSDKDEVLERVLDEVCSEILEFDSDGASAELLLGFCYEIYRVMVENPGVGRMWTSRSITVPNMALITERAFELLADCDLDGSEITNALDTLVLYIVGGVAYNLSREEGVRYGLAGQDTPLLDELMDSYADRDPDSQFRWGLDRLWAGISSASDAGAGGSSRGNEARRLG